MGICDASNKENQKSNENANLINNNIESGKYFQKQNSRGGRNSLIINNDVLVSDTHKNPEKIYIKEKLLGEGSFGSVWLVKHSITGKQYAMKIIQKSPYSDTKQIINEIEILKQLDHPNILKVLEFHLDVDKFYIITDYCKEGELFNEISEKQIFTEKQTEFIIYQVLQAVRYCHKMKVLHRDLKPENIMITEREPDGLLHVKIIDFGTAKLFDDGKKQKAMVGSSYYMAPEVIRGKYDEQCDLWSVGVIMYIMLVGTPPFNGDDDDEILNEVLKGKYDTTCSKYQSLSANAKDLMTSLLKLNPSERITAEQALAHPWFRSQEFQSIYRAKTINEAEAKSFLSNLEYYKSTNIIRCAVIAYLVHQNTNSKECVHASYLFDEIDLNKDGKLEKNELEYAFTKYFGLTPDQAKKKVNIIFENMDTDANGYIESEEFIRAAINPNIYTKEQYILAAFQYFDTDGDGNISIAEIEEKFFQCSNNKNAETRRQLKEMFDQIDANKDGQISLREFSDMIKGAVAS